MNPYTITKHRRYIQRLDQEAKKRLENITGIIITEIFLKKKNQLSLQIYRSKQIMKNEEEINYPTIIYIPGTGYVAFANQFDELICSEIALRSKCQVIEIRHRLAPEYQHPVGFFDVYTAYLYLIYYAKKLRIDLTRLALCGYSSGGNFAALTALRAKQDDRLQPLIQILISPITDLSRQFTHYKAFENQDSFPELLAQWFIDSYLPNKDKRTLADVSPFWANNLKGLPATYFLFGSKDRFRGDSEYYKAALSRSGVWTHTSLFKKAEHSFLWFDIRGVETVAAQTWTSFGLFVDKPLSKPAHTIGFKKMNLIEPKINKQSHS